MNLSDEIMCLGLFFTTGFEAKAEEQVKIIIDYLYVNANGDNACITKEAQVDKGTTWKTFLNEDKYNEYKPEKVIGDSLHNSSKLKSVSIQRKSSATMPHDDEDEKIRNFNEYMDHALLEYYLYPDDYREIYTGFEYYEGDEIKDSGTGGSLLIPASYADGNEETYAYICKNFIVDDYLRDISNIPGVKLTVSNRSGSYYILTFKAPAKSTNKTENSEKSENSERTEVVVVTEPTAETIADPSKAVTDIQAVNSINKNIEKIETDIKEGKIPADSPASINLGRYHSLSINTMTKFENVSVDVVLTYQYKGKTYTVKIPKGYKFDKNIPWYGPLYMYQLFGQSIN